MTSLYFNDLKKQEIVLSNVLTVIVSGLVRKKHKLFFLFFYKKTMNDYSLLNKAYSDNTSASKEGFYVTEKYNGDKIVNHDPYRKDRIIGTDTMMDCSISSGYFSYSLNCFL